MLLFDELAVGRSAEPAIPDQLQDRNRRDHDQKYTEIAAADWRYGAFEMFSNRNSENGRGPRAYTMYVKLNSAAASVQQMILPAMIPSFAFGTMTVRNVRGHDAPSDRELSSNCWRSIDWKELCTVSTIYGDFNSA